MDSRLDQFISDNELDEEIKDSLIELVNGCFADYVSHMSKEWLCNPIKTVQTKEKKVKLEDPTEVEKIEDLRKCTSAILNEYCKTHELKIGGDKKEIMGRVWRHLQGETSDDDAGRKAKAKKAVVVKVPHACFAHNAKGAPCGIVATEEFSSEWFCCRHIDNAEKILSKNTSTKANVVLPEEIEPASTKNVLKKTAKPIIVKGEDTDEEN